MKVKLAFFAGAAVGYVLGARAGQDRYEEIKHSAESLWHDPRVQEKVSAATETAKDTAGTVADKAKETAGIATDKAKEASDKVESNAKDAAEQAKDKADEAKEKAKEKADQAKDEAKDKADQAKSEAKDKAKGSSSGSESGDSLIGEEEGSDYEPKETKFQSS